MRGGRREGWREGGATLVSSSSGTQDQKKKKETKKQNKNNNKPNTWLIIYGRVRALLQLDTSMGSR